MEQLTKHGRRRNGQKKLGRRKSEASKKTKQCKVHRVGRPNFLAGRSTWYPRCSGVQSVDRPETSVGRPAAQCTIGLICWPFRSPLNSGELRRQCACIWMIEKPLKLTETLHITRFETIKESISKLLKIPEFDSKQQNWNIYIKTNTYTSSYTR